MARPVNDHKFELSVREQDGCGEGLQWERAVQLFGADTDSRLPLSFFLLSSSHNLMDGRLRRLQTSIVVVDDDDYGVSDRTSLPFSSPLPSNHPFWLCITPEGAASMISVLFPLHFLGHHESISIACEEALAFSYPYLVKEEKEKIKAQHWKFEGQRWERTERGEVDTMRQRSRNPRRSGVFSLLFFSNLLRFFLWLLIMTAISDTYLGSTVFKESRNFKKICLRPNIQPLSRAVG